MARISLGFLSSFGKNSRTWVLTVCSLLAAAPLLGESPVMAARVPFMVGTSGDLPSKGEKKSTKVKKRGLTRLRDLPAPPLANIEITSMFGARVHPVTGTRTRHEGVDYDAELGDKVFATLPGKVKFAGVKRGYGKTVEVHHPRHNATTLYAHLHSISVRKGQKIGKGQTLGLAGSTGLSTGVHLHFGVRNKYGRFIEPLAFLARVRDGSPNYSTQPDVIVARRASKGKIQIANAKKGVKKNGSRSQSEVLIASSKSSRVGPKSKSSTLLAKANKTSKTLVAKSNGSSRVAQTRAASGRSETKLAMGNNRSASSIKRSTSKQLLASRKTKNSRQLVATRRPAQSRQVIASRRQSKRLIAAGKPASSKQVLASRKHSRQLIATRKSARTKQLIASRKPLSKLTIAKTNAAKRLNMIARIKPKQSVKTAVAKAPAVQVERPLFPNVSHLEEKLKHADKVAGDFAMLYDQGAVSRNARDQKRRQADDLRKELEEARGSA